VNKQVLIDAPRLAAAYKQTETARKLLKELKRKRQYIVASSYQTGQYATLTKPVQFAEIVTLDHFIFSPNLVFSDQITTTSLYLPAQVMKHKSVD